MKAKIESIVYYPIYLVKMAAAIVTSFTAGFIRGWNKPID